MSKGLDYKRVQLIEAVLAKGRQNEPAAIDAALSAIRNPSDKQLQALAADAVAKFDACYKLTREVIDLINAHWPKPEQAGQEVAS